MVLLLQFSSLFWADSESGLVERSDLKGCNRRTFIPNDGSIPSALIVYEDRVYWKSGTTFGFKSQLFSIGVDGQGRRTEISDVLTVGLVAFDVYKVGITAAAIFFIDLCMRQDLIITTTSNQPSVYRGGHSHHYTLNTFERYNGLAMYAQDKQPEMESKWQVLIA